jgi:hypothetical protein
MHDKTSNQKPIFAVHVTLFHLLFHLIFFKCYTFSAFIYRLFCTKIPSCNTVTLEINFSWIFFKNRLRRLRATAPTAISEYQRYNANWRNSVAALHALFPSTNHSFEYQEEAHGVKG